jgi:hypothetical protein
MLLMPWLFVTGGGEGFDPTELWFTLWLAPFMIIALSKWLLDEHAGVATYVVAPIGYAAALLALRAVPTLGASAIWPLMGALTFTIYMVLSRRPSDPTIEPSLFYTTAVARACLLPCALPFSNPLDLRGLCSIVGREAGGHTPLTPLDRAVDAASAVLAAPCLPLVRRNGSTDAWPSGERVRIQSTSLTRLLDPTALLWRNHARGAL